MVRFLTLLLISVFSALVGFFLAPSWLAAIRCGVVAAHGDSGGNGVGGEVALVHSDFVDHSLPVLQSVDSVSASNTLKDVVEPTNTDSCSKEDRKLPSATGWQVSPLIFYLTGTAFGVPGVKRVTGPAVLARDRVAQSAIENVLSVSGERFSLIERFNVGERAGYYLKSLRDFNADYWLNTKLSDEGAPLVAPDSIPLAKEEILSVLHELANGSLLNDKDDLEQLLVSLNYSANRIELMRQFFKKLTNKLAYEQKAALVEDLFPECIGVSALLHYAPQFCSERVLDCKKMLLFARRTKLKCQALLADVVDFESSMPSVVPT